MRTNLAAINKKLELVNFQQYAKIASIKFIVIDVQLCTDIFHRRGISQ